jgi:membrane protease YdiL (CAAX protease family)
MVQRQRRAVQVDADEAVPPPQVRQRPADWERVAWHGPKEETLWNKSDIFEVLMYLIMIIFFIAVFQNVTYLGSTVEAERIIATQYLAIAALGTAGLAMRAIFDRVPIRNPAGEIIAVGYTETVYESKNITGIGRSLFYFALAFGVQAIMSFVIMALPLSVFEPSLQLIVLGIIAAVGEELFFSYFVTGLLVHKLKWACIPVVSMVFVWYHFVVYQTLTALLMVGVMRLVYSTVYIFSRRLSSVTLAHVMNNLLVGLRM